MALDKPSRSIRCVVVTPERALLDQAADFVALPMYDGELGVAPGRAPLIGRLGAGELRIRHADVVDHYYVDGGFAQVQADVVTVLTNRACKTTEIDVEAARRTLEAARKPATTPEAQAASIKNQQRARAQLHLAGKK